MRKANLEKKAQLVRQHEQSRPDPVLGFAKGNDALWDKSLLKSILLNRDEVWAQPAQADATGAGADAAARGTAGAEGNTPELYNFGLDAQTAEQLSSVLPATAALRSTLGDQATSVDAIMLERFETATTREEAKRDALMRIVDLRNADSKGIEVENTRRIVATFGRTPGDTASPEVQCALLFLPSLAQAQADRTSRSRDPDDAHPLARRAPHLVSARRAEPPGAATAHLAPRQDSQVPPRRVGQQVRGVPRPDWRRAARGRGRGNRQQGRAADHDPRGIERESVGSVVGPRTIRSSNYRIFRTGRAR